MREQIFPESHYMYGASSQSVTPDGIPKAVINLFRELSQEQQKQVFLGLDGKNLSTLFDSFDIEEKKAFILNFGELLVKSYSYTIGSSALLEVAKEIAAASALHQLSEEG